MKTPIEEWARRIIEARIGKPVIIHDDGSKNGMYDLRIGSTDAPTAAIECVGAVDQLFTETWNVGPAKGPFYLQVQGDWYITVKPGAHIKTIKKELQQPLQELESKGIYGFQAIYQLEYHDKNLFDKFKALGIENTSCYNKNGTGKVHLGMPGTGGGVDSQGDSVPGWVGAFLRDAAQQDVIGKLQRSRASDCHVFIPVSLQGAPWSVESYLTGEFDHLPNQNPDLPSPITQVWIISTHNRKGIRWNGTNWHLFDTEGI